MAHRNSLRLLKLVNTLLDFSRIEAGRIQANYEATDLALYTAELASVFRSAIEKAGMTLLVECPPLPDETYVDRDMWEKIVMNLLSNAFKYTFEGQIAVRLAAEAGHVELRVEDSGIGIPAHELPRLFERFHRIQGARSRSHEGTGIGLALVQELVKLHGGAIRVESESGKGSCFMVSLPFGSAHLPAERIGSATPQASMAVGSAPFVEEARRWLLDEGSESTTLSINPALSTQHSGLGIQHSELSKTRPRVLVADDNVDMLEYVTRLLAGQYDVQTAPDGEAALDAARRERPDLILSDVMMPRLDGFGLLRALRDDPETKTIPVILLSARAGEESRVEGMKAGADDYLIKPFSARELLARVEAHVKMARMRRENEERVSGILNSLTDGFQTLNADYRFSFLNPAARRTFVEQGMNPDELIGRHILDEVFPAERDRPWAVQLRRAMVERVPTEVETFYAPWQRWFAAHYYPALDGGVSVFFQDITDRKLAEENVLYQKRLLEALTESVLDGILIVSSEGHMLHFNRRFLDIWQFPPEILQSRSDEAALQWAAEQTTDPVGFRRRVATVYEEMNEQVREELRMKDGRVYERFGSPVHSGEERMGWVWTFRDITDRKRAESMSIEQTHLMEHIASGSPLDEILTELCVIVPKLNPRARACVLLADEQRKKISGTIAPNLAPEFGASLQDAPINDLCIGTCGEAMYSGKPIVCADVTKDERWSKMWRDLCVSCGVLAGYSTPILGADGLPLASFFLCFGEPRVPDAWELKLAEFGAHVAGIAIERARTAQTLTMQEEALRRLNDELEQRVAARTGELVQSQSRLRELATELNLAEQRERKRLAGDLHDYLAQLLVLGRLNLGQILKAGPPPIVAQKIQETDEVLGQGLMYCRTLIAELSPPALLEHGLPAGLTWLAEQMTRRGLTVRVDIGDVSELSLPEDRAVLLFQSVRELLINALKHAGSQEATVCVEMGEDTLRIEVCDDGVGFDLAAADSPTAMSSKFGLFSIRERMAALGGSFDIESAPGRGTMAILSLPLALVEVMGKESGVRGGGVEEVKGKGLGVSSSEYASPLTPYPSRVRVLLVDDHAMVRQGLRSVLDSYPDIEVVGEAWNGEEAVAMAARLDPSIIVMDINMPKKNGIEATCLIKKSKPETIVIGLSVQADAANEEAITKAGAALLLTKEAAVDQLYAAIKQTMLLSK